jgi:hypothetical protein
MFDDFSYLFRKTLKYRWSRYGYREVPSRRLLAWFDELGRRWECRLDSTSPRRQYRATVTSDGVRLSVDFHAHEMTDAIKTLAQAILDRAPRIDGRPTTINPFVGPRVQSHNLQPC